MSKWKEISLHETTMEHLLRCVRNENLEYTGENGWDFDYECWRLFRMIKEDLVIKDVIEDDED